MKWISKPPLGTPLNWAHPLNKGLVGFWLFNEGMGDKAYDISGNGNHGTLTGMAFPPTAASGWNPGRKGRELQFDGVNDYVNVGNGASLSLNESVSLHAIIKFVVLTGNQNLVGKGGLASSNPNYLLRTSNQKLELIFRKSDNSAWAFFTSTDNVLLSTNVFYDLSATHIFGDGTQTKLYVNGVSVAGTWTEGTGNESPLLNNDNVIIGAWNIKFNGSIDEVRIWNRALSAPEVQELYINPYGMFV